MGLPENSLTADEKIVLDFHPHWTTLLKSILELILVVAVAGAAHNRFFAEAVERVRLSLNDVILLLPESPLWQQRSLQEHQRIFAALEAGDSRAARQAVLAHVGQTARSVRALLKAF